MNMNKILSEPLPLKKSFLKKVLLFPNATRDVEYRYTIKIGEYLQKQGIEVYLPSKDFRSIYIDPAGGILPDSQVDFQDLSLTIAMGGDGTMVQCAHYLFGAEVPIIGVNLGHLGYMTEIEPGELTEALDRLIAGDFRIEKRMILEGTVVDPKEKEPKTFYAVNEFVIHRDLMDSLLTLTANVDKEHLGDFRADGVIVCSPCGSTAYNFSAGGPILSPVADNIVLTPLCSHSMLDRSLVLRGEDTLSFHIPSFARGDKALFSADARETCTFGPGSTIYVRKSSFSFCLAKIGESSFYEIMQRKMRP